MSKKHPPTTVCSICGQTKPRGVFPLGETIREQIVEEVHRQHPHWTADQPICYECLNRFRAEHVRRLLEIEKGELSVLEEQVVDSLRQQELISANVNLQFERQLTVGERLSDRLADFGGSWSFLIVFAVVVIAWMAINAITLRRPFDPYPFILLNLVLSCLAAVQAPVILMSQNRQEAKDRLRSEHDYRVDLKAELEIRLLHTKLDQLLTHQWQRLLEIQALQTDLMEEAAAARKTKGG
jgi:uncharacterized membrane protein